MLIVHSFGSAAPPFTTHSIAFETELTEKIGERVDLDEVSLDLARYSDPDMQEALVDYIRKRQAKWQPDLVVPIGSPAGGFVAQYRDRLFPETTILYTGMDRRRLPPDALQKNAAFVGESFDVPGFVEDILQVAPATTNIAVVIGASPVEQFWAAAVRQEFEQFTNRVGFTWLNEISFDQMLERVGKLPPHSFIFVILLLRDATGVTHNADEALKRIHAVANAPVNSIYQHQMGLGITGGRLYQAELEGVESARIAIRILHGEPASNFPPQVVGPLPPRYDWRELRRWGIGEEHLPQGGVILFREPSFWELYHWLIAGSVLFFLCQAALIVSLLINRAKRKSGEAEAALIADISLKFVNLPPGEVDREIVDAQRRICAFHGFDLSTLWQWSVEAPVSLTLTHRYRAREGPPPPERMDAAEYFPWCQEQLLAGRLIAVASLEELPSEAVRDRETWRHFGIKTSLTIPLSAGGGLPVGALTFNTTGEEQEWPEALVKRLQLVAQIFTNALVRKRADQALRESEERMTLAAETAGFGVWVWNIVLDQVWGSERWLRLFGFTSGEGINFEKFIQRIHSKDRETVEREIRAAVASGSDYSGEFRAILPDGTERWIVSLGRAHPDASGKPMRRVGAAIDITERKRAEAALRESEELSRASFEQAGIGIAHVGIDGRWLRVNDKVCAIVGYQQDELLRLTFQDITHPEDLDTDLQFVREILAGEIKTYTMEKRYIRKDRSTASVVLTVSLVRTAAGVPLHFISVIEDITGRKQAETELLRQRAELAHVARVSMMGELAASVAHELNQPLGAILANAEAAEMFLRQDPPALEDLSAILGDIRKDDERAGDVIRHMRALLSKHELERQPLEINSVAEDVLQLISGDAALRGMRLTAVLVPNLPKVSGDHIHLQQVLLNLILNGMDAMTGQPGDGRQICVRTRLGTDGMVELAVIDAGHGIPPDRLPRLFEPFYTTKPSGMGMGLSIARTIIEAHHGRIWAENNASGGATFRISLPVSSQGPNNQ